LTPEQFILELEQTIIRLIAERDAAIKRVQELEKKLAFYENPHTPPSQETLKKKIPEENIQKKRGAPVGHRGATRETPTPEETVVVPPAKICPKCGKNPGESMDTEEQIVEELVSAYVKAVKYFKPVHECQHCGFRFTTKHEDCPQKGNFGPILLTYVTMLKYNLRGPYRRVQEFMAHNNDFDISTKGLMDMILRVGEVSEKEYREIIARIRAADWVHIDETGMNVNGEKWWLWIFRSNKGDVLVVIRKSRGEKVVKEILGEDFKGPAVVDGWKAYLFIKKIQRCWSHLIREVKAFEEVSENGKRLYNEIHSIFAGLKRFLEKDPPMDMRKRQKKEFDKKMEILVERYGGFEELEKPITYIRNGLGKWFTCLLYPGMEPTNNLGEQAIREHVIIRRIIGCFRSENGSQNYQYIASLLASWKLQGKNMFVELEKLLRRELCLA